MSDPLPKLLYHYTTPAGLLGILETHKLWATNAAYLNDPTELRDALPLLAREVEAAVAGLGEDREPDKANVRMVGGLPAAADGVLEFYVTSLCEHRDVLSQWRGYGGGTGGFALGFHADCLESDGVELMRVLYEDEDKQRALKPILELAADLKLTPGEDLAAAYRQIMRWNLMCKNRAFEEEGEWRLVTWRDGGAAAKVRVTDQLVVPYVELPGKHPGKLPLAEIWVGPTRHPKLTKEAIEAVLPAYGYSGVDVKNSVVPLRD